MALTVLLVEDNPGDALLATKALEQALEGVSIVHVDDGEQALSRLRGEAFQLVILDLNLPGLSGLEVLRRLRGGTERSPVPVLVLSSSDRAHDVRQAYAAGCNAYLVKPHDLRAYRGLLERAAAYWLATARLPA